MKTNSPLLEVLEEENKEADISMIIGVIACSLLIIVVIGFLIFWGLK